MDVAGVASACDLQRLHSILRAGVSERMLNGLVHVACRNGSSGALALLVERPCNLGLTQKGDTPLDVALSSHRAEERPAHADCCECVRILVRAGARPARNVHYTFAELCARYRCTRCLTLALEVQRDDGVEQSGHGLYDASMSNGLNLQVVDGLPSGDIHSNECVELLVEHGVKASRHNVGQAANMLGPGSRRCVRNLLKSNPAAGRLTNITLRDVVVHSLILCTRRRPEDRYPGCVCERAKLIALLVRAGAVVEFSSGVDGDLGTLCLLGLQCTLVERFILARALPDEVHDEHARDGWSAFRRHLTVRQDTREPPPIEVRDDFWSEVGDDTRRVPSLKTLAERSLCAQVTPEQLLPAMRIAEQFDAPLLKAECDRVLVQQYHASRKFIKSSGRSSRLLLEATLKRAMRRAVFQVEERRSEPPEVEPEDSSSDDASDDGEAHLHEKMADVDGLNVRGFREIARKVYDEMDPARKAARVEAATEARVAELKEWRAARRAQGAATTVSGRLYF